MASRLTDQEIQDFMEVLLPIQVKLIRKYGYETVNGWREERLLRRNSAQIDRDILDIVKNF